MKEDNNVAIQEQIDMLRQEVSTWNVWRKMHPDEKIDLSYADLSYTRLHGIDLSYANLSYAKLIGANLSGTNLSEANLNEANLNRADLSYTNLKGANFFQTDLRIVNFFQADLSDANLGGADLFGADLRDANLNTAHLKGANFFQADLKGVCLSNAIVGFTTFGNLDLSTTNGLETIQHQGPSTIGVDTIYKSHGKIPEVFLRGTGVQDSFIEIIAALTNQPIEYYTCFISYSSKDELFTRRLHNDLQQEGVRCWFAPEDMDIGDKIKHRIDESIRLYDKLLLILSEHSINSSWVAYEVERALNKEPQDIPNVLYPVRVDRTVLDCTEPWAQDIKSTRHIGNFEEWTDPQQYEKSFKRLLRALNTKKDQPKK